MLANRFEDFFGYIIPEVGGQCPAALMKQALYSASREFCLRSMVWKETMTAIDLVADQEDYDLKVPWDARIEKIVEVRQNTEAGVDAGNDGANVLGKDFTFQPNESGGVLTLRVAPQDAVTDGLEVDVVYVPHMGKKEDPGRHQLPQWLMNRYGEAITGKAMAELMSMPQRNWSNVNRAAQHLISYRRGISNARRDLVAGYGNRVPTVLEDY